MFFFFYKYSKCSFNGVYNILFFRPEVDLNEGESDQEAVTRLMREVCKATIRSRLVFLAFKMFLVIAAGNN